MPVAPVPLADLDLALVPVAEGFTQPVFVDAPADDPRLFVVDQPGTITVFADGSPAPFLDLTGRVNFGSASEQGLLGLAFHPGYATNGRFFVHYTGGDGGTVLEEYAVSEDDPSRAGPDPVRTVLTAPQPAGNHNGGMIAFGPDGYLYLALGDGGGANDQFGNGQNTETLLGAILRIDVDQEPYGIPPDNVFAAGGGAPEIWAYGLRNPWRFSFDGDQIFIADVGQNAREEIDVASSRSVGLNFGWPLYEGNDCFAGPCDPTGLIPPAFEYPHEGGACSVTGGYVYRGAAIPELAGAYFFADYCSGVITSFRIDGEGIFEIRDWTDALGRVPGLTSFGTDGFGEIYLTASNGSVYRIEQG
jgi:glucose/arabinose dehydrogenase